MAVPDELLLLMNEFEEPWRLTKPFTLIPNMLWVPLNELLPSVAAVPAILPGGIELSAIFAEVTAPAANLAEVMPPSATLMVPDEVIGPPVRPAPVLMVIELPALIAAL